MAMSLYDPERHRPLTFRYLGIDAGVLCLSYAPCTLWQLGYPDQAVKQCNEAIALAQRLTHPISLACIQYVIAILRQFRREAGAAQEIEESMIALCTEYGFSQLLAFATVIRGWAMAELGHNEAGIAQIQEGIAASRATGSELMRAYSLSLLLEACMEAGLLDDRLNT
jgi:predicted ATPase